MGQQKLQSLKLDVEKKYAGSARAYTCECQIGPSWQYFFLPPTLIPDIFAFPWLEWIFKYLMKKIKFISVWNQRAKGVAWRFTLLLVGQSTQKTIHEIQIDSELLSVTATNDMPVFFISWFEFEIDTIWICSYKC